MNAKRTIPIVIIIALLAVGALVYVRSTHQGTAEGEAVSTTATPETFTDPLATQSATGSATETTASPSGNISATEQTGSVKAFTVTGTSFKFAPATMVVNAGDTVRITFKNAGGVHDFVIDELKVATKQNQSGQEETVQFVATKPGTYNYYCSVGNHRAMGMEGTLTVK